LKPFEEVLDLGLHLLIPHGLGCLVDVHHHGPLEVGDGAGQGLQGTAPRATSVPRERNDAPEPSQSAEEWIAARPERSAAGKITRSGQLARSRQESRAQEGGQLRPLREAPRDPAIGRVSLLFEGMHEGSREGSKSRVAALTGA
jgi:hypothetical protein